jgi:hypothetical protein
MAHSVARDKHAEFHGCAADQVQSQEVETESGPRVETTGCGKTESFVCMGAKCRSPRILSIRHHSNTNHCKHADITTQAVAPDRWKVTGCGVTQIYRCRDDSKQLVECKPE